MTPHASFIFNPHTSSHVAVQSVRANPGTITLYKIYYFPLYPLPPPSLVLDMDSTFRSNSGISPSSALRPSNHSFPFNTTFQQPSWSPAAQNNPNREHYIMLDRSVGWIRTTEQEAREGASIGYAVFDLAGYRPSWDPSRNRSARAREEAVVGAFERQFVEVWDAEEQVVMALEAHLDEEIYYGELQSR